jgi:hypothetical protein
MNGKPCLFLVLIACLCLISTHARAQDDLNITSIGQYYHNWSDGVYDICVQGDYAYLACGIEGLRILSMAEHSQPVDVGHFATTYAGAVAAAGNYVYLGAYNEARILDVSNPASPVDVAQIPTGDIVNAIRPLGNLVAVCARDGLRLVDVSNPASPQVVWAPADSWEALDIEVHGNLAYAVYDYHLVIADISDLSSPQIIGTYAPRYGSVTGVSVLGNYAYLSCGDMGLQVVDLSTLQEVASIDTLIYAYEVRIVNGLLYVHYGDFECPLAAVDISNPLSPQTLGVYYPPEDLFHFAVVGNAAYVADRLHGLRMVDFSDPQNPREVDRYSRYGHDWEVSVSGDRAYVKEDNKLKVIDIADVQHPHELGYFETQWNSVGFAVVGEIAYVVQSYDPVLQAVDVSNPASPSLLGSWSTPYSAERIAVYDHYAYVEAYDRLYIVDISNPGEMQEAACYHPGWYGNSMFGIYDHYAFLQRGDQDLRVLDLSDPTAPTQIASYNLNEYCLDMKGADGFLYVITLRHLWVFNATSFQDWSPLAVVELLDEDEWDWNWRGIDVQDQRVYLTNARGLSVYDVSDRTHPQLVGSFRTPGSACDVAALGNIAVVADSSNLGFYDCTRAVLDARPMNPSNPLSFALLANYPNPFNSSTRIQFQLATAEHVQLEVFNSVGQLVTTLMDGTRPAGSYEVAWNGTSSSGLSVASGLYIYRIQAGSFMDTKRMMLVR